MKNRVYSPEFPSSIEWLIYQKNVSHGQYWLNTGSNAYQAMKDAWRGQGIQGTDLHTFTSLIQLPLSEFLSIHAPTSKE
ncbi:hypothetical protein [Halobacillus sp. Marseille-P3879]|uniref:hypothetical protein n=1 Tax=Halobacillus sp. Marseille-P3879 TaxID=2045014 RepID=UPI00358FF7D3